LSKKDLYSLTTLLKPIKETTHTAVHHSVALVVNSFTSTGSVNEVVISTMFRVEKRTTDTLVVESGCNITCNESAKNKYIS
jgi:hypothetical protein